MRIWFVVCAIASLHAFAAPYVPRRTGNFDFPVYTNNPFGKQLTGVYTPTQTPALAPEESQKLIHVPKGFEARLFASEPEVVNPVAMTWDERGRLWVLELYEYPKGAPKGQKGRDRIKILEDTDADGKADKATVFADGFSLATGLALGNGGVYLGVAPDFLFLEDTNGVDKVDKTTVLKTGFGMEDRHELLNGFAWGPDGWLYMTHGVFTHSAVRGPEDPNDHYVKMDAALARYHPKTKKFEVFADGTSNPWGVDWNERGDAFVSACVIHHLFHMAPGGQYNRQGGTWHNPFGYVQDLPSKGLPAIVDWRHFRAAHSGICIYQGDQWPAEWRGLVFLGNIHESAINCDRLAPVGSTYKAERETKLLGPPKGDYQVGGGTFLASDDRWFRPVSIQTGPDGAMWVMDWYDKYPCYQNAQADPEGVDREHGRIWRIVWTGDQPGKPVPSRPDKNMDLKKLDNAALSALLKDRNSWRQRQAGRLMRERDVAVYSVEAYSGPRQQPATLLTADSNVEGIRESASLDSLLEATKYSDARIRAAAAAGVRRFTSGSYTIDTTPPETVATDKLLPHFRELLLRPSVDGDFYYPHIVWMAMEPRVALDPQKFFPIVSVKENSVSAYCLRRVMRRICDLTDSGARMTHLNAGMQLLGTIASKTPLAEAALDGLIDAFKAKGEPPNIPLQSIFDKLTGNPAIADKARRLATLFGDTAASRVLIGKINDDKASLDDRLKGITAARETKDEVARGELLKLFKDPASDKQQLYTEALRAISVFGGDDIAYVITDAWKKLSLQTRRVASEVLVLRSKWSRALLAGVDQKVISPDDISATARRTLARADDATTRDHADRVLGRYRATGEDKLKLIAQKRKVVLDGQPDLQAGHEVAKKTCFVCHKLHNEGADVGPDLTGVGRSTLDALLHNVIDPNEVVGHGYETTEVELKDGRSITGRIVEDTPSRLKLVASGPTEHIIARSDIDKMRTSELSLMPDGLEQMPDPDFRDMVWYILNPPEDNRPMNRALRAELLGEELAKPVSKP